MCIRDRSDTDFISSSIQRISLELEENSIQKKDYQTLITIDPADLINELAQKENTCTEIINMTEFLMERNKTLEEQVESLLILSLIHISEPTRPLYISYAVFCLKKKKKTKKNVNKQRKAQNKNNNDDKQQ
eukprot:TRINITY_DN13627_c0_g1_i2.p2 TRINITY_DN13627_c0_g1~~TRINITY_DN13627_c0_g1_i2.p2  ORF type:complete len:131 (-),score=35.96 TRINITY_DN13627_c0_g1_i2:29-421(-)